MKKHTPMAVGLTFNRKYERLTIGVDLGDRSSFYCMLVRLVMSCWNRS
jgi:hypothetical protein